MLTPARGRAIGSRRVGRPARAVVAAGGLAVCAGLLAACSSPTAPAGGSTAPEPGIGSWPTFLPSPTPPSTPEGSLDSPAMAYPGSPVVLHVGTAQALWDVEGPSYPDDTKVGAEEVRCTFTVTVSAVTAPITMKTASFDVLDQRGAVHALRSASGHAVPDRLEPGHTYALALVGTLPAGEGLLRYYPSRDGAVAAWDYVAETD